MGLFINSKQERLDNRLYKAIYARDLGRVQKALDEGASCEPKGHWGWVFHAANKNFPEAIPLLIEKGCSVDAKGAYGRTGLGYAAAYGHIDVVRLLLENGADVNSKDENSQTALHAAAQAGRMDIISILLDHGADVFARDRHMNTPADKAGDNYPRVAEFLWQKMGISPDGAAEKAAIAQGWHLTADDEIAHVSEKPAIGYRITDMFNFKAQIYTRIMQNTQTQSESAAVKTFDELSGSPLLREAMEVYEEKTGRTAEAYAQLKPKLPGLGRPHNG